MTVGQSLARIADHLSTGGIADSRIEAEVLLRHMLGMDRAEFFAALAVPLTPSQEGGLRRLVGRRLDGEPLAYITGHREFYGLDLVVGPAVLIPRQETELLVDNALELCAGRAKREPVRVADVGTGCGGVAIAIAAHLPDATVYATDISPGALAVADVNRRRLGVSKRVHLCQGDLLEPLPEPVDIIVSNPPYISTDAIADLADEVRREPTSALDGGTDGLAVTRRLLDQVRDHLRPGGCVLVEIDSWQLESACRIAREAIPAARVSYATDLLGSPRVVVADLDPGVEQGGQEPVLHRPGGRIAAHVTSTSSGGKW